MSRFLLAAWPFEGHVYPQMSVACALRDRGHEVAFYTGEAMRGAVEREGFRLFPFQRVDESRWLRVHETESKARGRRESLRADVQAFRGWFVETIPDQVADLEEVMQEWKPEALVVDNSMWGPITILREAVPIPVAAWCLMGTVIPGPDAPPWGIGLPPPRTRLARARASAITALMDVAARGVRRRVNEFRARHDLPPIERSVSAFAAESSLYLVAGLPELDYNRRDLPPSVHYVGACVWHPPTPPDASASLDAIPSDLPWIHATEGTSHYQKPFLLKAAAQGLGGQPMHVILTTGAKRDPEALGLAPLPSNVHLARWVSHTELLPRCAVVVTTGGANTIVSSLQAGTPLVVVPTTWDKPDNARRVVEAGVGVRLSARKCTPERLREAIEHVLAEPAYRANAQRIAAAFRKAPGPTVAADLLEGLVARDHGSVGARAL